MDQENQRIYIPVRESQINYYREIPLYYKTVNKSFALYKPSGTLLSKVRIKKKKHPKLFIRQEHRIKAITELQKGFNKDIAKNIKSGKVMEVKSTLCNLVEETLSEPRSGTLKALPKTIDLLVSGYSKQPDIIRAFALISFKDYTTVIHSVNVMALTIGFCFHANLSIQETKKLGLGALLHDVGKTKISKEIIRAPRKLTDEEFEIMKSHPTLGNKIIRKTNDISGDIALSALEHHEKLDGSGYPRGIRDITFGGQILGIIDCYEALTNEDRPYRRAKDPLETLKLLKNDVESGKYSRKIFEKFCYSLI
jgi:HD-GYP domain-containing protein (c-di-GMP phosphodiesterase class II)